MEKLDAQILEIIKETLLVMEIHRSPGWESWLNDLNTVDIIVPMLLAKLPDDMVINHNFKRILSKIKMESTFSRNVIPATFSRFYPPQLRIRIYYTDDDQIEHDLYNNVVWNACHTP